MAARRTRGSACAARSAPPRRRVSCTLRILAAARARVAVFDLLQQCRAERRTADLLLEELRHQPPSGEQVRLREVWHLDEPQCPQQKRRQRARLDRRRPSAAPSAASPAWPFRRRRSLRRGGERALRLAVDQLNDRRAGHLRDFLLERLTHAAAEAMGARNCESGPPRRDPRGRRGESPRQAARPRPSGCRAAARSTRRPRVEAAGTPRALAIDIERNLIRERMTDEHRLHAVLRRRTPSRTAAGTARGRRPRRSSAHAPAATPTPADSRTARCAAARLQPPREAQVEFRRVDADEHVGACGAEAPHSSPRSRSSRGRWRSTSERPMTRELFGGRPRLAARGDHLRTGDAEALHVGNARAQRVDQCGAELSPEGSPATIPTRSGAAAAAGPPSAALIAPGCASSRR